MHSVLDEPRFRNEQAAYAYVESVVWPDARICPHCGVIDKSGPLNGKSTRIGVYKCYACRKPFTVKVGTIFEKSHVPMHVWLQAMHLMCSSKKGFSSLQFCRVLGVDFKTGWFIGHRIREAMSGAGSGPLGGDGGTVEIDETYVGGKAKNRHQHQRGRGRGRDIPKAPVFALVERGGRVRAFHVPHVTGENLAAVVQKHVARGAMIYSDENYTTRHAARGYSADSVNHLDGEYVRGPVHTNTVEGYFATVKRGLTGVYHSVSEAHLQRYLDEFSFRHSISFRHSNREALGVDDVERTERAIRGIIGKRLTYATPRQGKSGTPSLT